MGADHATMERLIRDDFEALSLWTEATRGGHGGAHNPTGSNQHKVGEVKLYNIHDDSQPIHDTGTSREPPSGA